MEYLGLTPMQYKAKIAKLEADNRLCNTKVSKLDNIVEGLIEALCSVSNCILDHEHNDNVLKSERFYVDSVIEDTYRRLDELK